MAFAFHDDRVRLLGRWSVRRVVVLGLLLVGVVVVLLLIGHWAHQRVLVIDGDDRSLFDDVWHGLDPGVSRSLITGLSAMVWGFAALAGTALGLIRSTCHHTVVARSSNARLHWSNQWLSALYWVWVVLAVLVSLDAAVGCVARSLTLEYIRGGVGVMMLTGMLGVAGVRGGRGGRGVGGERRGVSGESEGGEANDRGFTGGYDWVVRRETLFFIWLVGTAVLTGGVLLADGWSRSYIRVEQAPFIFQDWFALMAASATIWIALTWQPWRPRWHRNVVALWVWVLALYYASTLGAWLYQPRVDKAVWAWVVIGVVVVGSLLTSAAMYRWSRGVWLKLASVVWPLLLAYGLMNNHGMASVWEVIALSLVMWVMLFAGIKPVTRW